jgi:tetratricopeptide (TPR) repeat protein
MDAAANQSARVIRGPLSRSGRPHRARFCIAGIILVLLGAAPAYFFLAPRPPAVALDGADPAVTRQIRLARRTVYLQPWSSAAWGRLGALCYDYDFYEAADLCLARAAKLDSKNARWVYLRGRSLNDQDPKAALPLLAEAARLTGDLPAAPHLKYGEALLEQGNPDEAAAQFNRVLARDPDDARASLGAGRVALARGNLEEARRFLEQSVEHQSDVKATHSLLAGIYQRQGDSKAAQEELRQAAHCPETTLWNDPYLGEALGMRVGKRVELERAASELSAGKGAAALRMLKDLARQYPDAADVWVNLGVASREQGDLAAAEQADRTAVRLAPKLADAYNELGNLLFVREKYAEAEAAFRQALQDHPEQAKVWFNLGTCLLKEQRPVDAERACRQTVRLKPDFAAGYTRIGEALLRQDKNREAAVVLKHALELDPQDQAAQQSLRDAGQ